MWNKALKKRLTFLALLVVTFVTTTIVGGEWMYGKSLLYGDNTLSWAEVLSGMYFSMPFLLILTVHEMGHYVAARLYKIAVTLPYYIPFWLGPFALPSIGTMGAFIRIKGKIFSRKEFFDIGVAGPLAGFVLAIGVIYYGFTHLPEPEYIFEIHPEYRQYGLDYEQHVYDDLPVVFMLGDNLVFQFFEHFVADPERVPNKYEMYHYPWLFAGYLALFFTALNLIPIGQLDGGHVLYGLLGVRRSRIVSRILFLIMVTVSGVGLIPFGTFDFGFFAGILLYGWFLSLTLLSFERDLKKRLLWVIWIVIVQLILGRYAPVVGDYSLYLFFSFLIGRFLGVDHPVAIDNRPLSTGRRILGWITLAVFVVSFTPRPLYVRENPGVPMEQPGNEAPFTKSEIVTRRVVESL
jgi:Zn-dependent protease